jgi:hypothetical protein
MNTVLLRCTKCGTLDMHRQWNSLEEAANKGAFEPDWACPSCAWPEPELIEIDVTDVPAPEKAAEGDPARAGR